MQPQNSVLVVDDESALRKALCCSLAPFGYQVEESANGGEALKTLGLHSFDVVLLDVNMPGMSGIDACRRIRGMSPRTGIIMVTVHDDEDYKVKALEAGADDYVTKPFKIRELTARLQAVLRRTRVQEMMTGVITAGKLKMDVERRQLWSEGEELHLSPTEFDLLAFMMKNMGTPLTRTKLLRSVWGPEYGNELEYLRSYVKMLRKKIESNPSQPEYILTEPWVGYRFQDPTAA